MCGAESKFVQSAFESNWIASLGPNVEGFEKDLTEYLSEDVQVTVLSSGTAALHLALILLGVGPGDEVICQSLTFAASANPILYQGAIPVFVDSERETWNMSPYWMEQAIKDRISRGKKPKAIVVVHLYGMPAQMSAIMEIARRYEIPVIEDAAEALGSSIDGRKCGTMGDLAVLSFNGNKIITTSGGGALVTHDPALASKAKFLATQARDPEIHYEHSHLGFNYRLSNICAGIGRGQMTVLAERVQQRRANFERYQQIFSGQDDVLWLPELRGDFSNRWLSVCLIEPAIYGRSWRNLYELFEQENIESRPVWKPMHLQPLYSDAPFYGDGTAEELFGKGICLPSGSSLAGSDWNRIRSVVTAWSTLSIRQI